MKDTRAIELSKYPTDDGTTQVLSVAGLLTPALARKLLVGQCYDENGVPQTSWSSYPSPGLKINGAEIWLGGRQFRATLCHKLKIVAPKTGNDNDTHLELKMLIHFSGKEPIGVWLDKQLKALFVLELTAAQSDLSFQNEEDEEDEEKSGEDD